MSTTTEATAAQIVLGRYTTLDGPRWVYARRDGDRTVIIDQPAGEGRSYQVDVLPDSDGPGAVDALVREYLADARSRRRVPMAPTAVEVRVGSAA